MGAELDVVLEPAHPRRDPEAIAAIARRRIEHGLRPGWSSARVRRCITHRSDTEVLVARDSTRGGAVVGFAILTLGRVEDAYLELFGVAETHEGQGLGRRMMDWLLEEARAAGVFRISLHVRAGNDGALAFYRRLGFRDVQRHRGHYEGREDGIEMRLVLYAP